MNKKFVWIGAGSASNPKVNFDDFDSIVLVDARKEACDELNEHFKDNAKVTTKQVCISERNGESVFFQCNVEELSALAKPAQLKSLYPGLKVKSYDVDIVSIIDFLKGEIVDGGIELFIDTPATSLILVRELSKSKFLDNITKLRVSIGTVPALYEVSADITELTSLLKEKCFEEVSRDSDDPDIPVVSFKLNENLKAIERLKAENSDLKQQLIESTKHNEENTHKANKLNSDLAVKNDLIEAKDIEIQTLKREVGTSKADLQKKSLDCDELCNQLEVSKSTNLVIENKLAEEHAKVAKLTKELEEQATKLKRAEDICDSLKDVERKISEELADSKSRLTELTEEFDAQASMLKITVEALETSKESEQNKSTELKNSQSKLDTLTNELSQLRLKIEERERNFEANENKIAELSALLDNQKADLHKQYEINSELSAQNKKISEERDKEHNWHMENKQWAEGLASSQSSTEAKYQDASSKLTSLQEKYEKQELALSDSLSKEKNLASALSINTKLMKKLEVDLNDLRLKYEEKKIAEAELKKLVSDLYIKLQQAASFYHKLEQQYPELVIENVESEK
ncbi:hypothetical protein [Alteromonas sp. A079]|uniref:hypothetical protein n=1 Tax=Alteromonas sp. A079 TaxID=3410268 RepID=UPI003B9F8CA9